MIWTWVLALEQVSKYLCALVPSSVKWGWYTSTYHIAILRIQWINICNSTGYIVSAMDVLIKQVKFTLTTLRAMALASLSSQSFVPYSNITYYFCILSYTELWNVLHVSTELLLPFDLRIVQKVIFNLFLILHHLSKSSLPPGILPPCSPVVCFAES